jgi:hypothetical protein
VIALGINSCKDRLSEAVTSFLRIYKPREICERTLDEALKVTGISVTSETFVQTLRSVPEEFVENLKR